MAANTANNANKVSVFSRFGAFFPNSVVSVVRAVRGYAQDGKRKKVEELYDLASDIGETTNLADKHPKKVAELKALMKAIGEGKA